MSFVWIVPVLLSVVSAATPLLLAATGELVTEKSGVLNLGIEGMMLVGAVIGFAVTMTTGSTILGIAAAATLLSGLQSGPVDFTSQSAAGL